MEARINPCPVALAAPSKRRVSSFWWMAWICTWRCSSTFIFALTAANSRSSCLGVGFGTADRGAGTVTSTCCFDMAMVRAGGLLGRFLGVACGDGERRLTVRVNTTGAETTGAFTGRGGDGLLHPAKNPVCLVLVGVRGIISFMALAT